MSDLHVTPRLERCTSIIKLKNARKKEIRNIAIKYWLTNSNKQYEDINFLERLAPGQQVAFDVLNSNLSISRVQFTYREGSKSYSTPLIPGEGFGGSNQYIRDLFHTFAENENEEVTYFYVLDGANKNIRPTLTQSNIDVVELGLEIDCIESETYPGRVSKRPIGKGGNIDCLDIKNSHEFNFGGPNVENFVLNLKSFDGIVHRIDILAGVFTWPRVRLDFDKTFNCVSAWAEWDIDGQHHVSPERVVDSALIWGEFWIQSDGVTGGIWIWLDWLMVGARGSKGISPFGHAVPIIGQRKTMGCWLACFAMLHSWKEKREVTLGEMIKILGGDLAQAALGNTGITPEQAARAANMLDLKIQPPSNPTADQWVSISSKSPLFVVVREELHPNLFGVHAKIVTEVRKVPSSAIAEVDLVDPAANNLSGGRVTLSLREFIKQYEMFAGGSWLGVQILSF